MAHFVFLTHGFFPDSDANISCTYNVMAELLKSGDSVTCICGAKTGYDKEEIIKGVRVIRVRYVPYMYVLNKQKNLFGKVMVRLLHTLKSVLVWNLFPDVEPEFTKRLYKSLVCLNEAATIDCVIGVFRPYSTIEAALRFGKNNPKVKTVGWYLDVLKGAVKPSFVTQGYYEKLCDKREPIILDSLNEIIMPGHARHYYEDYPERIKNKMSYVEFPTLVVKEEETPKLRNSIFCSLLYAGSFDKIYRNPVPLFETLIKLNEKVPVEFHYYGGSNMEETIHEYSQKYPFIICHGYAEKQVVENAVSKASLMVSVGNNIKGIVPSKIFELFSTLKPIVHFTDGEIDGTLPYFEKYPNVCVLNKTDDSSVNADKLFTFLKVANKIISRQLILETYPEANPENICKLLKN